jgi:hypothetical protein
MDIYPHMLKSACETWFKTHYTGAYHSSFRIEHTPQALPGQSVRRRNNPSWN